MAEATINKTVRAKRRASTQKAIRERAERGETHGNERALVRVGTVNTKILTGQEDLSVWSEEELRRGQRKDKNGRWQGRPPAVVPKAIHDELVRRTMEKAVTLMNDNLVEAVQCLVDIIQGGETEDKDRIKAASMIIDRVMGRAPERVEISATVKPWQQAVQGGIVRVKPGETIIDSTATEDDDD